MSQTKMGEPTKCDGCDRSLDRQLNSAYVPVRDSEGKSKMEIFYLCDGCNGTIPKDTAGRDAFLERLVGKRYPAV